MLDEIFDMFQDRSRKRSGSSSGGLMGRIGRMLEGDAEDHSRTGSDRRFVDRDYRDLRGEGRDNGYDDRQYADQDRRFGNRPREADYQASERGFSPDDRRFDARGQEADREYRRRDDDEFDDGQVSSRERKRRAFDFELDD